MRKLRPAELEVLHCIPKDLVFDPVNGEKFTIQGDIRPCDLRPKKDTGLISEL